MNAHTYINIGGQTVEAPANLPDRKFRNAWVLDAKGTVTLDPVRQREIFVGMVKREAGRRIEALAPEHKQRNVTARGVELMPKQIAGTLTKAEQAEWAAGEALWAGVKAIRERSNALENGAILDDVTNDRHWA
jgi:hypothetical protein